MPYIVGTLIVLGIALVAINAITLLALWRSKEFERTQKLAQSALLWLIPGFFIVVRHLLHAPPLSTRDPTVPPLHGGWDYLPPSHHHGNDGGPD